MSDLSYSTEGMFTQFFADSLAGENAWRTMAVVCDGNAKIFTIHLASTLAQLRNAGYVVRKAKKSSLTMSDIMQDDLLAELMA